MDMKHGDTWTNSDGYKFATIWNNNMGTREEEWLGHICVTKSIYLLLCSGLSEGFFEWFCREPIQQKIAIVQSGSNEGVNELCCNFRCEIHSNCTNIMELNICCFTDRCDLCFHTHNKIHHHTKIASNLGRSNLSWANVAGNIFKVFCICLEEIIMNSVLSFILSLLYVIQVWISLMKSSKFLSTGTSSLTLKWTYIWVLSA